MFRKPKRNVRQRKNSSEDDENEQDNSELQSTLEKFKETAKKTSKNKHKNQTSGSKSEISSEKKSLLSFDGFDGEADDGGEVFRVKKSSQSRRLMRQLKSERKQREKQDSATPPLPSTPPPAPPSAPPPPVISEDDLGIKIKSNLVINKLPEEPRTLTGYEAEALHMEEEDLSEENDENETENDPLQEILQRGDIPDAAAIFAARKRRQAAREKGQNKKDFISLNKEKRKSDQDESGDSDEERTVMTGVKTEQKNEKTFHEETDDRWEEQQIRKAMKTKEFTRSVSPDEETPKNGNDHVVMDRRPLKSYNLEGIKDRLNSRITSLNETYRAHCNEADKIVTDMMESQQIMEEKESKLPLTVSRHQFYQDLKGYLADLVECFNEKMVQIKFVEDKYHKLKGDLHQKLAERRREDVRDQMRELSNANSNKANLITAEENNEEWSRQRRAAEREGRRRRRAQLRHSKLGQNPPHNEGMSSDDELSSHDQANISKVRQDVENQARTLMTDVVEDFSTIDGVLSRMQDWKNSDKVAYNEAYVSLCLHKLIAPLVTLQLLFWNPLEDHSNLEDMEWHEKVANYKVDQDLDKDNQFLTLVVEKVVMVKVENVVKAAYDPLSSSQTLRLTQLLIKLRNTYPSLTGSSKQVRNVLTSVIDKFKNSIDNDVYIPLGFSKNSESHGNFLNRQYWSAFKLFKNCLSWHGLISDKILSDLSLSSILNRYLLIGLGVTSNPMDCVFRTRHVITAIPNEWKNSKMLERFIQYLVQLGSNPGLNRESVKELAQQLKSLGSCAEAENLERKLNA